MDREGLYRRLGVSPSASAAEIRKAYHKLARTHHPDKGGDAEKFKEIQTAFETLGDESKRALYDAGRSSRNGGGPAMPPRRRREPPTTQVDIELSMDETFSGCTRTIRIQRTRFSEPGRPCAPCAGQGFVVRTMQIGPGMMQQTRTNCGACKGAGMTAAEGDGRRESKTLQVPIPPGVCNGQRVTLHGEGDQAPGLDPGDLVLVVKEARASPVAPCTEIRRDGPTLTACVRLTLAQALLGDQLSIELPGKRTLALRVEGVIRHGEERCVPGEGMPSASGGTGYLIVRFEVIFPKQLSAEQRSALRAAFPDHHPAPTPSPPEAVAAEPFTPKHRQACKTVRDAHMHHQRQTQQQQQSRQPPQQQQCAQQ